MATLRIVPPADEKGQAVIELALTLPLLLFVVLAMFDFGLMFQRFEVVTNAAREGARVGVLPDYTTGDATLRALDYLQVGGLGSSISAATRGTCGGALQANSRCVSVVVGPVAIPGTSPVRTVNQVTVTVEYDHQHVFVGPISQLFGGNLGTTRLRSISTMRKEN